MIILRRLERKKGELNLPLVYFLVAGVSGLFIYVLYLLGRFPQFPCVFKTVTGYPCPTCGTTRSVFHLLHFDIVTAFLYNPLFFLGGIVFGIWVIYGFYMLFSRKKVEVTFTKNESRFLKWGIFLLFILNWLYLIAAGI